MRERPTPESDYMYSSNDCNALGFWLMTQHARKLERQRDAAKELADKLFRMRAEALKEIHNQFVEYDKLFDEAEIIKIERDMALYSLGKKSESKIQKANAMAEKAQALIDRWDKPSWKDTAPTAGFIYALRTAVEDYEKTLK